MKIIISPAKKMNVDTDTLACRSTPVFLEQTEQLLAWMRQLTFEQAKELWKCNDRIAEQNYRRFQEMNLNRNLTPAVIAYEGIQYQYMAPAVMEEGAFAYLQEHLRILSAFYGMLRPFDGVVPYRLEMQARMGGHSRCPELDSLYDYWGAAMAEDIAAKDRVILNLASKEYSRCITRYLREDIAFVTCVFGERSGGKVIEKGTLAKMARGEMVRFLAQSKAGSIEEVRKFKGLGYRFQEAYSDDSTLVFLKEAKEKEEALT